MAEAKIQEHDREVQRKRKKEGKPRFVDRFKKKQQRILADPVVCWRRAQEKDVNGIKVMEWRLYVQLIV